jgi:hypothetical protein
MRRIKLVFVLAVLAALCLAALNQSTIIGWWRGEAKYKGRYTNSWRAELRAYDLPHLGFNNLGHTTWYFERTPSPWEGWFSKLLPSSFKSKLDPSLPLQDGDPEAVLVLVELLEAPEANVRFMAAYGLETICFVNGRQSIRSTTHVAIAALLAALNDEDEQVAYMGWCALHRLDPAVAAKNNCVYHRGFGELDESP